MSMQERKGISFSAVQRIAVRSAAISENARCRSHIRESLKDWHTKKEGSFVANVGVGRYVPPNTAGDLGI
jgi:hypothetical protein